jgi:hypothetical protein
VAFSLAFGASRGSPSVQLDVQTPTPIPVGDRMAPNALPGTQPPKTFMSQLKIDKMTLDAEYQ